MNFRGFYYICISVVVTHAQLKRGTNTPFALVCLIALLYGCTLHTANEAPLPSAPLPVDFSEKEVGKDTQYHLNQPWWYAYHNEEINQLMAQALSSNFTLQSAWNRLEQAHAQYQIVTSGQFPQMNVQGSASRSRSKSEDGNSGGTNTNLSSYFSTGTGLSYEVDLWGRMSAEISAGKANLKGSRADLENTALLLSGQIAELWIQAQTQKALLKLLNKQIELGNKLLELTKVRFRIGRGSILDVYQQQQQLRSTQSEMPTAESSLKQTLNQIAVLVGLPPSSIKEEALSGMLPPLPPFPEMATPAALLDSRPDLRAIREQVISADFNIASAMANRLPQLNLSLSYSFQANNIADLFSNEIGQMLSSMGMPLFDGGSREAQVEYSKARTEEVKNLYSQAFLTALQDVENAVIAERYQLQTMSLLEKQISDARSTLQESRNRYMRGLNDYLQVVFAVQSLQNLERRSVYEQSTLLITRNRLYLALGGTWTRELSPHGEVPL